MKRTVECEKCGFIFEENGVYDLAKDIIYHVESGACEERQEENKETLQNHLEDLGKGQGF